MTFVRNVLGILVGFVQALPLAILLGWACRNERMAGLAFVAGWPLLSWRILRKPPAGAKPPLLRRSIVPLLALPVVAAFPVAAFVAGAKGYAGAAAGLVALTLLACLFAFCWGAAFMALLAHLGTRKKP